MKTVDFVFVGGGSGGHLTPLIPVAEALKNQDSDSSIVHIGQKGDALNSILLDIDCFDLQYTVSAGKYRRYNGEGLVKKLFDIKTNFFNARDLFKFILGIIQSWLLLGRLKPKVIFMKGGYVCAPVGIAARIRGIPYITHDSDAMVSLAHRIIAKKAKLHLTAMPPEFYNAYDQSKTRQVGVPVRSEYSFITEASKAGAKAKLGFTSDTKVLLVVGGGNGAKNINNAIVTNVAKLLEDPKLMIVHIAGHKLYEGLKQQYESSTDETKNKKIVLMPFTSELHQYSAAADVIVARAGATNMAEFAAQGKACIIVPNPLLAGGHQLKNAQALKELEAVIIVDENKIQQDLLSAVGLLLNDADKQLVLAKNLHKQYIGDAADKIALELRNVYNDEVRRV